ncbi:MAG: alpha/beta fold hydrolase [Bacteroidales bacterium]|nr:alpha/beta fold hydrolase [Bacteroidales bacterium]
MKTILRLSLLFLFLHFSNQSTSQINENSILLKSELSFEADSQTLDTYLMINEIDGVQKGELYIPAQLVFSLPADSISFTKEKFNISFTDYAIGIVCNWNENTKSFTGFWTQGNSKTELEFYYITREEMSFVDRPQTPNPPFEYITKDYKIKNEENGAILAGTLSIPDTTKTYPLVVLVTGSSLQDRDETIFGHKPFSVIANYLTNNDIAVFRYDDRGYGESTGNVTNATTYDFMTDALSVIKFFETHKNIDKIGVLGHSEGGQIAIMLAANYSQNIDFIISLAGPAAPIIDVMLKQSEYQFDLAGYDKDDISVLVAMQKELYKSCIKYDDLNDLKKITIRIYEKYTNILGEEKANLYGINPLNNYKTALELNSAWFRYFIAYNPIKDIREIRCPVLALNGDNDKQVDAEINLNSFEKNLKKSKSPYYAIHSMEGLNHLFQHDEIGSLQEYYMINETISEEVLEIIKDFINKIKNIN